MCLYRCMWWRSRVFLWNRLVLFQLVIVLVWGRHTTLMKQVIPVTLATYRWTLFSMNKKVIIYSGNSVTLASFDKGSSRNSNIMKCLRGLFWLSAFNFHLTTKFIPVVSSVAADSVSRLHLPDYLRKLFSFTDYTPPPPASRLLPMHISSASLFAWQIPVEATALLQWYSRQLLEERSPNKVSQLH